MKTIREVLEEFSDSREILDSYQRRDLEAAILAERPWVDFPCVFIGRYEPVVTLREDHGWVGKRCICCNATRETAPEVKLKLYDEAQLKFAALEKERDELREQRNIAQAEISVLRCQVASLNQHVEQSEEYENNELREKLAASNEKNAIIELLTSKKVLVVTTQEIYEKIEKLQPVWLKSKEILDEGFNHLMPTEDGPIITWTPYALLDFLYSGNRILSERE